MTRTRTRNLSASLPGLPAVGLSTASQAQAMSFLAAQFDTDTIGQFVYWRWVGTNER